MNVVETQILGPFVIALVTFVEEGTPGKEYIYILGATAIFDEVPTEDLAKAWATLNLPGSFDLSCVKHVLVAPVNTEK